MKLAKSVKQVSQISETGEQKWNCMKHYKKFYERKLPPRNGCVEDDFDVKESKIFD